MNWDWLPRNADLVARLTLEHLLLALVPVLVGLAVSIPLGRLAVRTPAVRTVVVAVTGVLYTVPSLALIVVLPIVLGTRILDPLNVVVALTIYTVALLVRSVADALDAVPAVTTAAATAMGYRPLKLFLGVELPLAVPVIIAGLRVAVVSNTSMVTVGALVGVGGLGRLFTDGFQRDIPAEIITGIVLVLVLALLLDATVLLIGRSMTGWNRVGARAGAKA